MFVGITCDTDQSKSIKKQGIVEYYTSPNIVLLYSLYQFRALFRHIQCYSYNARSTGRYLHQVRTG